MNDMDLQSTSPPEVTCCTTRILQICPPKLLKHKIQPENSMELDSNDLFSSADHQNFLPFVMELLRSFSATVEWAIQNPQTNELAAYLDKFKQLQRKKTFKDAEANLANTLQFAFRSAISDLFPLPDDWDDSLLVDAQIHLNNLGLKANDSSSQRDVMALLVTTAVILACCEMLAPTTLPLPSQRAKMPEIAKAIVEQLVHRSNKVQLGFYLTLMQACYLAQRCLKIARQLPVKECWEMTLQELLIEFPFAPLIHKLST